VDDALAHWRLLLDPAQCSLPDALTDAIHVAVARRTLDVAGDSSSVTRVVELASELGFL